MKMIDTAPNDNLKVNKINNIEFTNIFINTNS